MVIDARGTNYSILHCLIQSSCYKGKILKIASSRIQKHSCCSQWCCSVEDDFLTLSDITENTCI